MLPLKASGSVFGRDSRVARVSGYLSQLRNRRISILLKLSAKKIYQQVTKRQRRIQISIASACPWNKAYFDSLSSYADWTAKGQFHFGCVGRSFFWSNRDRDQLVKRVVVHYPETIPLTMTNA